MGRGSDAALLEHLPDGSEGSEVFPSDAADCGQSAGLMSTSGSVRGGLGGLRSLIVDISTKNDIKVSIIPLIGSLFKAKFYTITKHLINKLIWTNLLYCDIIDRFS